MDKTFSLRRQDVICDAPMISDVKERWPALFDAVEVSLKKMMIKKKMDNVFMCKSNA